MKMTKKDIEDYIRVRPDIFETVKLLARIKANKFMIPTDSGESNTLVETDECVGH